MATLNIRKVHFCQFVKAASRSDVQQAQGGSKFVRSIQVEEAVTFRMHKTPKSSCIKCTKIANPNFFSHVVLTDIDIVEQTTPVPGRLPGAALRRSSTTAQRESGAVSAANATFQKSSTSWVTMVCDLSSLDCRNFDIPLTSVFDSDCPFTKRESILTLDRVRKELPGAAAFTRTET
ncbi:hypothetical protein NDU88_001161 [Pleurodeles waltl]|uniref:Uncharacterized protein n=1 Tax=Pleurodeles waltl TaxID=8319 RepID=A0AAV7KSQ2_PLEWA|nr:hypothetical protein NDU88_001161 [Pleurodeles waltl]